MDYNEFLQSKLLKSTPSGFDVDDSTLPENLYPYQKDLVKWAVKRGKAALFTMTGTGKTAMQVSWANEIVHHIPCARVLILAPLAVSKQTVREALKFGIHVNPCRMQADVKVGINIANYEMLHHFEADQFDGIVLDESSIIKAFDGKMRKTIIEFAGPIPYRLACTATPSPNDYMELGNHAEFLGVMSYTEMLATFFVHDGGDTAKWRLKGHAEESFWKWLASWGVFLTKPSDLGYSNEGFDLPALHTHQHVVHSEAPEGALFAFEARGLAERRGARKESLERRVDKCADIVFSSLIGSFCDKLAENKQEVSANDMETHLQQKQEPEIQGRSGVQREENQTGEEKPRGTSGLHESICKSPSGQIQPDTRTTGAIQFETQGEVRAGLCLQGSTESESQRIPAKEPPYEKSATNKEIQHNSASIRCLDGIPERGMCDLRPQRHVKGELLSCGRSLPCFGECARVALHELQHGIRDVQGFAESISKGGRIFEKQWVIWCGLNAEQDMLASIFGKLCISIYGSLASDEKEKRLFSWLNKEVPILITKPSIFGFGLNLQQCCDTAFVGLSDSFEALFQSTKRFHRHGQTREVNRHLIISEAEGSVLANVQRKEREFEVMIQNMVEHTKLMNMENIRNLVDDRIEYTPEVKMNLPGWL